MNRGTHSLHVLLRGRSSLMHHYIKAEPVSRLAYDRRRTWCRGRSLLRGRRGRGGRRQVGRVVHCSDREIERQQVDETRMGSRKGVNDVAPPAGDPEEGRVQL